MDANVVPALVSYRTPRWIKVAVRSYQRHFPGQNLLVIDNNPLPGEMGWEPACDEERAWLTKREGITLRRHAGPDRRHGRAIDLVLRHCREVGAEIMLLIEPDCFIAGTNWYELLRRPMCEGAWMSGMTQLMYGPLHPCPSMWSVQQPWASFVEQPRGADVEHPRYRELFWIDRQLGAIEANFPEMLPWWQVNWDTAQKNWFQAAAEDRAFRVPECNDIRHFWSGATAHRDHPEFGSNPQLLELLNEGPAE